MIIWKPDTLGPKPYKDKNQIINDSFQFEKKKSLKMCLISRFQADTPACEHMQTTCLQMEKALGVRIASTGGLARSQGHYREATPPGVSLSEGACALFPAVTESLQRSESGCSPCLEAVGGEGKRLSHGKETGFCKSPSI